jgi:chromosome segregation ATPase
MASAIAMAGSRLLVDNTAFIMVHLPWTITSGNAIDLRKEADTLDMYRDALISIYLTKFDVTKEQMQKMLEDETWIRGEAASMYGLKAEIVETGEPLRAAAFAKEMPKFLNTPKALKEIIMEKEAELKQADETEIKAEDNAVVENTADETPAEDAKVEVPTEKPVEVKDELTETDTVIASAEAERRVRGMQSKMAMQINALKKDYEAKIQAMTAEHQKQIEDFNCKLNAKCEELDKANAESLSRAQTIEKLTAELQETASALAKQNDALDELTTSVLTPGANLPTMSEGLARCKTAAEKSAFLASGKYRKG